MCHWHHYPPLEYTKLLCPRIEGIFLYSSCSIQRISEDVLASSISLYFLGKDAWDACSSSTITWGTGRSVAAWKHFVSWHIQIVISHSVPQKEFTTICKTFCNIPWISCHRLLSHKIEQRILLHTSSVFHILWTTVSYVFAHGPLLTAVLYITLKPQPYLRLYSIYGCKRNTTKPCVRKSSY
jgi:hypothetical protein